MSPLRFRGDWRWGVRELMGTLVDRGSREHSPFPGLSLEAGLS